MSEQTQARLVAAAVELFGKLSYENTSVEQIAEAAGVTKGAFYHHYISKEDLLAYIQETALDRVLDDSARIIALRGPVLDELRGLLRVHLREAVDYAEALLVSVAERRAIDSGRWALIRAKRDRVETIVADCIQRGRESGEFTETLKPQLTAYGLLGMCYWTNVWYRGDRTAWSVEQIADEFATLALNGVVNR